MGPKAAPQTRAAADGTTEQFCNKCQSWKPQILDFKAARGTKIVDTCKSCRDGMKSNYATKKSSQLGNKGSDAENSLSITSSTIVVDAGGVEEAEPEAGPVFIPSNSLFNYTNLLE